MQPSARPPRSPCYPFTVACCTLLLLSAPARPSAAQSTATTEQKPSGTAPVPPSPPTQTPTPTPAPAPTPAPPAAMPVPGPGTGPAAGPDPVPPAPSPPLPAPKVEAVLAAPATSPTAAAPPPASGAKPALRAEQPAIRRGNTTVASFAHAKAHLAVLYSERPRTLYSDCAFDPQKRIDYDHCRYRPRVRNGRAHRIEWEHVVPAEAFGHAFACWREGHPSCVDSHGRSFRGRRCAQRASATYRLMEADLYNLYPEIGEINQLRSNKPMGEPTRKRRELAPLEATAVGADAFLPRPQVRGDVARTYSYMHATYPGSGIIGQKRARLFAVWSSSDPVDAWECRRAWRIEAIQGNENRFVKTPCMEAGLWPST